MVLSLVPAILEEAAAGDGLPKYSKTELRILDDNKELDSDDCRECTPFRVWRMPHITVDESGGMAWRYLWLLFGGWVRPCLGGWIALVDEVSSPSSCTLALESFVFLVVVPPLSLFMSLTKYWSVDKTPGIDIL